MARNKIEDLRNHLFAAMERLNDEDLTPEAVEQEMRKAKALAGLSNAIIETAKIEIDFMKAIGQQSATSQLFKDIQEPNLIDKL